MSILTDLFDPPYSLLPIIEKFKKYKSCVFVYVNTNCIAHQWERNIDVKYKYLTSMKIAAAG